MVEKSRRVVVTGLGTISPVGNDVVTAWKNVCEGLSGINSIAAWDASGYATRIAGEVRHFDAHDWMPAQDARRTDPFVHYGVAASIQAFNDSGLAVTEENAGRIGVIVGSGIGGLGTIEQVSKTVRDKGPRKASPFYIPSVMVNMVSGHLSIILGLKGPNMATATACTTSTHAIGLATRLIQFGDADVMIAGGAEQSLTPTALAGFCSARAMSTRNDDPQRASRPWDRNRDGFVLSDGAGALVLEELGHAQRRGARIYAEVVGFGMGSDAYHVTSPPADGAGAARSMAAALHDAKLRPSDVRYLNAHATSTGLGDIAEVQAIRRVFGADVGALAISSTKSTTGHLLGAAGAVEAIYTILAMRDGVVPPTMNLDEPDDACDLDFVPHTARAMSVDIAMSNSFGFGGTNGTLVFRKVT